jgi:hypothetical protein
MKNNYEISSMEVLHNFKVADSAILFYGLNSFVRTLHLVNHI